MRRFLIPSDGWQVRDGLDTALRIGLGLVVLFVAVVAFLGPNSAMVERQKAAPAQLAEAAQSRAPVAGDDGARPQDAGSPAPAAGLPAEFGDAPAQAITTGDGAAGEEAGQGLTRAPPRPSLTPTDEAKATTAADTEDTVRLRLRLLPRPIAIDTATFLVDRARVRLAGIQPIAPSRECGQGSRSWPCGMQARTALRLWLRARSIRCAVPEGFGSREESLDAECSLGPKDVGEWLVENGWAEARPDGRYTELERRARQARRGIWGSGRDAPPPDTQ